MSNEIIVFLGKNKSYYSYDNELYTGTFPQEWAMTHLPGTGPKDCIMCQRVGHWNGVFVGYCVGCASRYNYNGDFESLKYSGSLSRGGGFIDSICNGENAGINDKYAAMNTYLANIRLDDIGDKDFLDSAAMMNHPKGISKTLREIMVIRKNK